MRQIGPGLGGARQRREGIFAAAQYLEACFLWEPAHQRQLICSPRLTAQYPAQGDRNVRVVRARTDSYFAPKLALNTEAAHG
jgi:hypothetical protein